SWAAPPSSRSTAPTITARSGAAAAELAGPPRRPAKKRTRVASPPERLNSYRENGQPREAPWQTTGPFRINFVMRCSPHPPAASPGGAAGPPTPGAPVPKYGAFSPGFRGCTEDKGENGGVE